MSGIDADTVSALLGIFAASMIIAVMVAGYMSLSEVIPRTHFDHASSNQIQIDVVDTDMTNILQIEVYELYQGAKEPVRTKIIEYPTKYTRYPVDVQPGSKVTVYMVDLCGEKIPLKNKDNPEYINCEPETPKRPVITDVTLGGVQYSRT
jgi:hypothetical protein